MADNKTEEFAAAFSWCRNPAEAARKIGVEPFKALAFGMKTLASRSFARLNGRLDSLHNVKSDVTAGLYRLAFGDVNEAAQIVFSEEADFRQIMTANLFNVSEIKKVKGGGVEIKFFDRQKALERLIEIAESQERAAAQVSLREQMLKGAIELDKEDSGDEE